MKTKIILAVVALLLMSGTTVTAGLPIPRKIKRGYNVARATKIGSRQWREIQNEQGVSEEEQTRAMYLNLSEPQKFQVALKLAEKFPPVRKGDFLSPQGQEIFDFLSSKDATVSPESMEVISSDEFQAWLLQAGVPPPPPKKTPEELAQEAKQERQRAAELEARYAKNRKEEALARLIILSFSGAFIALFVFLKRRDKGGSGVEGTVKQMKTKTTLAALLLAAVMVTPSYGADEMFLDGAEAFLKYRTRVDEKTFGERLYFLGCVDGFIHGWVACGYPLPKGVTLSQMELIVAKYVVSHPNHHHKATRWLMDEAVCRAFPDLGLAARP